MSPTESTFFRIFSGHGGLLVKLCTMKSRLNLAKTIDVSLERGLQPIRKPTWYKRGTRKSRPYAQGALHYSRRAC